MKKVNYSSHKRLGVLNQEKIIGLVEYVMNQHTELFWSIKVSETSMSVYVFMEFNNIGKICRISDHIPSRFKKIHNICITPRMLKRTVIAFLENTIDTLKKRHYYEILNNITIEQFNSMFNNEEEHLYEKENSN